MTLREIKTELKINYDDKLDRETVFSILFLNIISENSYYTELKNLLSKDKNNKSAYLYALAKAYILNDSDTPYEFLDSFEDYLTEVDDEKVIEKRENKLIELFNEGGHSVYDFYWKEF